MIGGAGLGKSTSLNYIFCNYEKLYHAFALKLKINLKDYAGDISDKHRDILWCLSTEFFKHIPRDKLTFDDIYRLLAEYLQSGKCLVIFDALDEIPVQEKRNKVRDEISTFCELYYLNRFIISSREVGYLKNRFNRDFIHIRINEFNMDQVRRYSKNWIYLNNKNIDFNQFWEKFSSEVERAKCQNLIQNPIILILALVIFDIENSLPNRRIEFYKKCIDTFLVVREDRKRAFIQTDSFRNILGDNSVVPKIAHYKFEKVSEDTSYRFTVEELEEAVMQAIDVSSRTQWRDPVAQFAKYLIDRTELIRETDEDSLDFTHKTFYEYFLAVYYAQEYDADDLIQLLDSWIGDSNNDEMARLIIEVIVEKNNARQHRTIMNHLLNQLDCDNVSLDVFLTISELYSHNMLQAKYHDRYYNSILFHPWLTYKRYTTIPRMHPSEFQYDAHRVAELFIESVEREPSTFYKMIPALNDLNSDFKEKLTILSNNLSYKNIIRLFEINSGLRKKSLNNFKDWPLLFEYFYTEQIDIVLCSPEIYLSLIYMALEKAPQDLRRMFDFNFSVNCAFSYFLVPRTLSQLFNYCSKSPENMLLLLVVLIHCAYKNTDVLFEYMLRETGNLFETDMTYEQAVYVQGQAILVWENLFAKRDFIMWKHWLVENSLYLAQYEELYIKLNSEYTSTNPKRWIKHFVKRVRQWREKTELRQLSLAEWEPN